ncbi:protein of unknown function [Solimonas aquatica]|uniref:Protein NO VEIN C-terminal domain-containing protein n=2 Tax=Solimonas aquatica TaxID=489703 RepID=A0A1H9EIY0_9GAMM|nr:protein of unknown function [Solimonas aquatica]
MLAAELAGVAYNKASHRRELRKKLANRSEASIEFKHANISAALLEAGFPYISGYKPRSNYQALLVDVLADRLDKDRTITDLAASDVERPIVVPDVDDILAVLTARPEAKEQPGSLRIAEPSPNRIHLTTNYLEREARNRSLGAAGETFVLNYETARLISLGQERLASQIEHTAKIRGDSAGFDIMSFDVSGKELLIEVKTTKYGSETPFYVSSNEVAVSNREAERYQVYRLFDFRQTPRLYTLPGAIEVSCLLSPRTYLASPR